MALRPALPFLALAACACLANSCPGSDTTIIQLSTRDLVFSPQTGLLYATVPGRAGQLGNSIVPINPANGAVGDAVPVGSEPGPMAFSQDGTKLHVGLMGAGAVRTLNFPALTIRRQFSLGFYGGGHYQPFFLAEAPGMPDRLLSVQGEFAGTSADIYDAGYVPSVRSPRTAAPASRFGAAFANSPAIIYSESNYGLVASKIDERGLVPVANIPLPWRFDTQVEYRNGYFYALDGKRYDAHTGALSVTYDTTDRLKQLLPEHDRDRVYGLSEPDWEGTRVHVFRGSTGERLETRTLSLPDDSFYDPELVRWGEDGLAVRAFGQVALARFATIPAKRPAVDLGVGASASHARVKTGAGMSFTVEVTNASDHPANNAYLTVTLSKGLNLISAYGTPGDVMTVGPVALARIGDLEAGGKATVTLEATGGIAGPADVICRVQSDEPDPILVDNATTLRVGVQAGPVADPAIGWGAVQIGSQPDPITAARKLDAELLVTNAGRSKSGWVNVTVELSTNPRFEGFRRVDLAKFKLTLSPGQRHRRRLRATLLDTAQSVFYLRAQLTPESGTDATTENNVAGWGPIPPLPPPLQRPRLKVY